MTTEPLDYPWIVQSLRPLAEPLASLTLDPRNAHQHNEASLRAIYSSLRTFGQRKPIVANRANGQIEAGNGTYLAAQRLGWTHLAVVWVHDDPAAQTGFALADNRSGELADWDEATLQALILEIGEAIPDLYDDLLLEELRAKDAGEQEPDTSEPETVDTWQVLVKCRGEADQMALLQRLAAEGYECRALIT